MNIWSRKDPNDKHNTITVWKIISNFYNFLSHIMTDFWFLKLFILTWSILQYYDPVKMTQLFFGFWGEGDCACFFLYFFLYTFYFIMCSEDISLAFTSLLWNNKRQKKNSKLCVWASVSVREEKPPTGHPESHTFNSEWLHEDFVFYWCVLLFCGSYKQLGHIIWDCAGLCLTAFVFSAGFSSVGES